MHILSLLLFRSLPQGNNTSCLNESGQSELSAEDKITTTSYWGWAIPAVLNRYDTDTIPTIFSSIDTKL